MSAHDLAGRVALVTGASSGIGACAARHLAAAGADVVLVGRDDARLAATLADLRADGKHRTVQADLTDDGAIDDVVAAAGPLDVLVQCAGVFGPTPFADITPDELDRVLAVNVRAPFLLARAALRVMRNPSAMVFVSSISGHVGIARQAAYGMSKSAVDGLTRTLAVELAPRGIRVNGVAPGFTATPMNEHIRQDEAKVDRLRSATLADRLGTPDDIARAIVYLASDAAAFVYGVTLPVDGGYPMSPIQTGRGA